MKKILIIFLLFFSSLSLAWAEDIQYELVSEVETATGTQIIIPEDISWTQRFILTELKELRIDLEVHQREIANTINTKELSTVDRALSYSANTVNFFFVVLTIAVMWFGIFGWKTMKDVKENLSSNFEKEVQKRINAEQKKLEQFMTKFEKEQLAQSKEILENQEYMQKKQEWAYYWSQFNREEDSVVRLELLDKIWILNIEDDDLFIFIERAQIYITLGLWDKALETSELGLEISSENTTLLYSKAEALVMLENTEDALKVINNILVIKPAIKEEIMEDPTFENLRADIEEIVEDNSYIV